MSMITSYDNKDGSGYINSRYTEKRLYECKHVDMHHFHAIANAIKMAEDEAIAYAKKRISDKVSEAIDKA